MLLEASLRLGGWIYYTYRIKNKVETVDNEKATRILCLGDSFTFGEGAPKGYSYPEQLEMILNRNSSKKFIVYNRSIPGSNSSQLFRNLENNIQMYMPDIIIIMTGCNNNNNLEQSNYFLFVDKHPSLYPRRLNAFLSHMRSYKLARSIFVNFLNGIKPRVKLKTSSFVDDKTCAMPINQENQNKEDIQEESREKAKRHIQMGQAYESQNKFSLAVIEYEKAIELNPCNSEAYHRLGFIYLHRSLDSQDKYELAIQTLKKAIEINPLNQSARRELFDAYYRSGKIDSALEELNMFHNLDPNDAWVEYILTYGLPEYNDLRVFKEMLKYDLQNIIALARSKKIKLILQNYPSNWPNEMLKQTAKINKIPFVDNESVFKGLSSLAEYNKQDYFIEDSHCNANGYRVIAENVYRVIKSELKE